MFISQLESTVLGGVWERGEDARLRLDLAWRQTPWGQWVPSNAWLANDALMELGWETGEEHPLAEVLESFERQLGIPCAFCAADSRFVLKDGVVRIAARMTRKRGIQGVRERLTEKIETFFEAVPTERPKREIPAEAAVLVCMPEGALYLRLGPFPKLFNFIKQLSVTNEIGECTRLLASNARHTPCLIPVDAGPLKIEAVGFEDDEDVFDPLSLPGLPNEELSVFRVNADDMGQLVATRTLALGHTYRLLAPPSLHVPGHGWRVVSSGWHFLEVTLTAANQWELEPLLAALGLKIGESGPAIRPSPRSWPDAWRWTPRFERYAAYQVGREIELQVSGFDADFEGECKVVVEGVGESQVLELGVGDTCTLELKDLRPGRYVCGLYHSRAAIFPEYYFFEVFDEPLVLPSSEVTIEIRDKDERGAGVGLHTFAPGKPSRIWNGSLGTLEDAPLVEGPAGWPVLVRWAGLGRLMRSVELRDDGTLSLDFLRDWFDKPRPYGRLHVGLGELGEVVLEHEHVLSVVEIHELLLSKVESSNWQDSRGVYKHLYPLWFEPVCAYIGHEPEFVPLEDDPPVHVGMIRLMKTSGKRTMLLERRCRGLVVMMEELDDEPGEELKDWVDQKCLEEKTERAFFTDGRYWGRRMAQSRRPLKIVDLFEVVRNEEMFDKFLDDFGGI